MLCFRPVQVLVWCLRESLPNKQIRPKGGGIKGVEVTEQIVAVLCEVI